MRLPPSALAVLVQGLSDQTYSGGSLPVTLPGAPGCDLLVSPDVTVTALTNAAGASSSTIAIPNTSALEGLGVFYQWVVLDQQANAIGLVTSGGALGVLGQ